MLKIPYGQSNFRKLILDGYFYQDRTGYIRVLETMPTYVYFLRPRRFGKSLFVSMLHHYYGHEYQAAFKTLFGHLAIGQKPTKLANQYLVLSFEFSRIKTKTAESTFDGFLRNVRVGVESFLKQYQDFFPLAIHNKILTQKEPHEILLSLLHEYNIININQPLPLVYLLIDEYDHFANELISFNADFFAQSVTQNGFVRKFYETIKTGTRDGIVDRLFLTGVSPITLDSLTSGFNIGTNISLFKPFHAMMGFEEAEVKNLLKELGIDSKKVSLILTDLKAWYNGYLFDPTSSSSLYNPDMVLYFALHYQLNQSYPLELLNPNIASDYSKIRNLFKIQGKEKQHLSVLHTLTESEQVTARLTTQFSLEKTFHKDDLISLLFYMGFLTIKEQELGGFIFSYPNYVIKQLYANYFVSILQEQKNLPIDNSALNFAIRELAKQGNPEHLYEQVIQVVKAMSSRDAQGFNENSMKAIFVSLLQQQQFYYVHSEYESTRKYVDVFLETIRGHPVNYEVAFELKYAKKAKKINIEKILTAATEQLKQYMISHKFLARPHLKAFVVLIHGQDLHSRELVL